MWAYNLQPEKDRDGRIVEGAHAFESRPPTVVSVSGGRASFMGRASSANGRRTGSATTTNGV